MMRFWSTISDRGLKALHTKLKMLGKLFFAFHIKNADYTPNIGPCCLSAKSGSKTILQTRRVDEAFLTKL